MADEEIKVKATPINQVEIKGAIAFSAEHARVWAEGTDEEVEKLGGEHSSKGWADTAEGASKEYTDEQIALAKTELTGQINTAAQGAVQTAKSYSDTQLAAEASARQNADSNLQTQIDALGEGFLQNTATGANALTISGTPSTTAQAHNVGDSSSADIYGAAFGYSAQAAASGTAVGTKASAGNYGVAIGSSNGAGTIASGASAIAIGYNAVASGNTAIQIGTGSNTQANTVQIKNTQLLNASGKVPGASVQTDGTTISTDANGALTVIGGGSAGIENTATGSNSLTILGTPASKSNALNVGEDSSAMTGSVSVGRYSQAGDDTSSANYAAALGFRALATGNGSVAVGSSRYSGFATTASGYLSIAIGSADSTKTAATGSRAIAIGAGAQATADYAIQLGPGTNSTASTLKVLGYQLLDASGKIPADRLPSSGGAAPTLTWYTGNTGSTVTIADTSSASLVKIYKNGILLQPTEDYSISGTTLTLVTALVSTDKITTEIFA